MATRPNLDDGFAAAKPARFVLRDLSRADHDRVDAAFSAFDLGTAKGYGDFLRAHYAAHREAECWLDLADLPPAFRLAERTGLIAADLADLGLPVPAQGLATPMPASGGFAASAGVLYCLAGSTFGARVLIQRLPPGAPNRFLSQPLPAGYWPRLTEALDQVARSHGLAATLAATQRTFALFAASAEREAAQR